MNAINTSLLCEEDPSHWIIMTPTFRLPKAILREEEFRRKGGWLQEEQREEAPPKEEEEIRLEFLEMFQEGVPWEEENEKRERKKKRRRLNGLSRTCLRRRRTNHL